MKKTYDHKVNHTDKNDYTELLEVLKMKLNNKYIIGCHVMFYEIEMVEEYLKSVHLALQDIENKENVKVEMMWNMSQYFEECESGEKLFEIKQRIKNLKTNMDFIVYSMKKMINHTQWQTIVES